LKLGPLQPLRFAAFALIGLILTGLVISAMLTMREGERLAVVENHLERMHAFDLNHLRLERTLTEGLSGAWLRIPDHRDRLIGQLADLVALRGELHPETPARLKDLDAHLRNLSDTNLRTQLIDALLLLGEVATSEHQMQEVLLEKLRREAEWQLKLEVAAPLLLLALGFLLFAILRHRVLDPLAAFGTLLTRLAEHDYREADLDEIDPLVRPLFANFNDLARRLQELDRAHRDHADSLESQVRAATEALLAQHRNLSRSERLAATGELAASVAHELRNPLAGIQMSLGNLRDELGDPALRDRIERVNAEVMRLSRMLSRIVDSAHQRPEAARDLLLHDLVADMLALMRYQVAGNIEFDNAIPAELECRAPDGALRQVLLNLTLNAARAIEETGLPGSVRFEAERIADGRLRVSVSDDGPGFPEELLRDGIRPFFSTREDASGGLGLPMVRRFVRDCGGDLHLENCSPRGARVVLLLPSQGRV